MTRRTILRTAAGLGLAAVATIAFFISASARNGRTTVEIRGGSLTLSWADSWWAPRTGWLPPPETERHVAWAPSIRQLFPVIRETAFHTSDGWLQLWEIVVPLWWPALGVIFWPLVVATVAAVRRWLTSGDMRYLLASRSCRIGMLFLIATWVASSFIWIEIPTRAGVLSIYGGAISWGGRTIGFFVDEEDLPNAPAFSWLRLVPRVYHEFPSDEEWVIPVWLPMLTTGLLLAVLRRRVRPGYCNRCGYDLTGNVSGRCPECGTPIRQAMAQRQT